MTINQFGGTAHRNEKTIVGHNSFLNGFFSMTEDCNYTLLVIAICEILDLMINSGVILSNQQQAIIAMKGIGFFFKAALIILGVTVFGKAKDLKRLELLDKLIDKRSKVNRVIFCWG